MINVWRIVPYFSASVLAVVAIYVIIRWRRAPAALRGISLTGVTCFAAGVLLGMWLLHEREAESVVRSPAPSVGGVDSPHDSGATKLVALGPHGVQVYDLTAKADAPMVTSISGPLTAMNQSDFPTDMDMDNNRDIYVLQGGSTILKFSAGSSGDASPMKIIAGPATSLLGGLAITVAPDGSHIFVASACGSEPSVSCILKFRSDANGNSTPEAKLTFRPGYSCGMYGGMTFGSQWESLDRRWPQ